MGRKTVLLILSCIYVSLYGVHINDLLFNAVRDGKIKKVEWCLDHGANVNVKFNRYENPIKTNKKLAAIFKIFDFDTDIKDLTPLHVAAINGHLAIARLLLKRGVRKNAVSQNERYPRAINCAVVMGHLPIVKLLYNKDNENKDKLSYGKALIRDAIELNYFNIFTFLCDQQEIKSFYPSWLYEAVRKRHTRMLKYFVTRVNKKFNNDKKQIRAYFQKDIHELLPSSVQSGNLFFTRYLLECGFDPNDYARYLDPVLPLLHQAAGDGNIPMAQLLLEYGADINLEATHFKFFGQQEYRNGGTPLHWAAKNDKVAMVKFLLQHGADADYTFENVEHPQIIYWLLLNGATLPSTSGMMTFNNKIDFNLKRILQLWNTNNNSFYSQGLFIAAYFNDYALMQKLFKRGGKDIDTNVTMRYGGKMPLIVAIENGNLACAYRLLIATTIKKDEYGEFPIDYAKTPVMKNMITWYTQNRKKFYHLGMVLAGKHGDGDLIKYCVGNGFLQTMNNPSKIKSRKRKWKRDHRPSKRLKRI